jgi:hypothetical protein
MPEITGARIREICKLLTKKEIVGKFTYKDAHQLISDAGHRFLYSAITTGEDEQATQEDLCNPNF